MGLKLSYFSEVIIYSCHLPFPTSYSLLYPLLLSLSLLSAEMALGEAAGDLKMAESTSHFAILTRTLWWSCTQFTRPSFLTLFSFHFYDTKLSCFTPTSLAALSSFHLLASSSLTLNIRAIFYIHFLSW